MSACNVVRSIIISFYLRRQTALDEVRGVLSIISTCHLSAAAPPSTLHPPPRLPPPPLNDALHIEDFPKFPPRRKGGAGGDGGDGGMGGGGWRGGRGAQIPPNTSGFSSSAAIDVVSERIRPPLTDLF